MKKIRKVKNFTLVELLVSLGVFSILLIIFMQFFSGMRLVWTNAEKNANAHADVRIAMDMLSTLLSSLYYSTANTASGEIGHFLFRIDTGTNEPDELYFATKTKIDLAGSNPIRFIGVLIPNRAGNLGVPDSQAALYDKLYLTVLSNKEGGANAAVYRQLFPQFVDASGDNIISLATAATTLQDNLQGKLDDNNTPGTDTENRIKLLDNVVDFKVRLLKADGTAESGGVITAETREIEIAISVLSDSDYQEWVTTFGSTPVNAASLEFRALRQTTFTRRISIGDRSLLEDRYE